MSITAPEARAELKKLYTAADEIEQKYPDGPITNAEDAAEVKRLLAQVDGLEDQLAVLDDAAQRKARITGRLGDLSKPMRPPIGAQGQEAAAGTLAMRLPGEHFVESPEYLGAKDRGLFTSDTSRVEFTVPLPGGGHLAVWSKKARAGETKALVYSGSASGGALVIPEYLPGVTQLLQRPIVVTDLVPHLTTTSEVISYVLETAFTNNAAAVAEATATTGSSGSKPESVLTYSTQTTSVRTIAHWIPVTNRILADAPALRGLMDTRLLLGLDQAVETQVLNGNGQGENLLGILQTPGILTQAAGTSIMNAVWQARQQVRVTGLANPNAVVMHPSNFSAVRLAQGTTNDYLFGPPSQLGPTTLWGLPVVESLFIPVGTMIVGDFQMGSTLFDREQGAIKVGFVNDQFIRNITTILAELRAAFVTFRPTAYCQVTGAP